MIDRLFLAHPRSVDETYAEHFGVASRFGVTLIGSGLACLIHALVPAWCERTGSTTVKRLHAKLAARQPRPAPTGDWQPEYEI